jgi:hypothetical protein
MAAGEVPSDFPAARSGVVEAAGVVKEVDVERIVRLAVLLLIRRKKTPCRCRGANPARSANRAVVASCAVGYLSR